MNWYTGSISDAVALSKAKNAIFVVFVEGKDDATQKMTGFVNNTNIRQKLESEDFVAIKIEGGSESYIQFASIFKIVPIPSIFFIGESGTPLVIATSVLNSVEDLEEKIAKVLELAGKKPVSISSATIDFIQEESNASARNVSFSTPHGMEKEAIEEMNAGTSDAHGGITDIIVCNKPNALVQKESEASNVAMPTVHDIEKQEDKEVLHGVASDNILCQDVVCFNKPNDSVQEASERSIVAVPTTHDIETEEIKEDLHDETPDNIVCKDGVCYKKPKEPIQVDIKEEGVEKSSEEKHREEAKLAETRKFLEAKRRERIEEEKRLEKECELRRRQEGKKMHHLRAWQEDQEVKELQENIKREKLAEQLAIERIRAQIAADKAERAHKFAPDFPVAQTESINDSNTTKANSPAVSASDETRLQFRLATGTCNNCNFKCSTTLAEIRDYVTLQLLPGTGIQKFTLATTYPKRELSSEDDNKTLTELELFPTAVILIIGKEATGPRAVIYRNGGLLNLISVMLTAILNPIFSIFVSAKNWFTGKRNVETGAKKRGNEDEEKNDVSQRQNLDRFSRSGAGNTTGTRNVLNRTSSPGSSQSAAYRRFTGGSNIHRLSDNRKDSDDENATWNGNSTQQQ